MKENVKYWEDSIISGITSYFKYGMDNDEYHSGDICHHSIPCLCVSEYPKSFQVICNTEFDIDSVQHVKDIKVVSFTIPEKYIHGFDKTDIPQLENIIRNSLKNINEQFKGKLIDYTYVS